MNDTLLIVDGHNLLFQMFFGMPSVFIGKSGKPIQGVFGFVASLLKRIRMYKPTHVVVIFDGEHHNDRTDIDQDYKANRVDYSTVLEEENPFSQFDDIVKVLDYLNIKNYVAATTEADDVIANLTLTYKSQANIIISSFDSDFFQLIDDNVKILRYRGSDSVMCDLDYLYKKHQILPKQYVFYKALVGDTADNIKGVNGIGKVTASKLLNSFLTIDGIYDNIEAIKNSKVRESLMTSHDIIMKNIKLIKLSTTDQIPFKLEDLLYTEQNLSTTEVLVRVGIK